MSRPGLAVRVVLWITVETSNEQEARDAVQQIIDTAESKDNLAIIGDLTDTRIAMIESEITDITPTAII